MGLEELRSKVRSDISNGFLDPRDKRFAVNALLGAIRSDGCGEFDSSDADSIETAIAVNALSNASGCPSPANLNAEFRAISVNRSIEDACNWLYDICKECGYLQTEALSKNIQWSAQSDWGELEITINCSKPEKDPRAIAKAAKPKTENVAVYPACQLCFENEGYAGRDDSSVYGAHPNRQNLRIIDLEVGSAKWGLQYSPYAYYEQHCIAINEEHIPMHIDRDCFSNLIALVEQFPHYFFGSNADLPIVGGSILSHDHFQGGKHVFALDKAPVTSEFGLSGFPDIVAGVVKWPATVLRLESENKDSLIDAACHILGEWKRFSAPELGIVAETEGIPHNTITPIARKMGDAYRFDLALRCNITSSEHPLGVFHPHEELHHIKKENIGLIEVMGLAILPGRLREKLVGYGDGSLEKRDIEDAFQKVLEHVGVFKWDEQGRQGLEEFLDALC